MYDISEIIGENHAETALSIARRVRERRLEMNLTQSGMAKRADISLASYRLFEKTGKISLAALLRIAYVLGCLRDFDTLFSQHIWECLDDAIAYKENKRERGKKS